MALTKGSFWGSSTTIDDEEAFGTSDKLLGSESHAVVKRENTKKTLTISRIYYFVLHIVILALVGAQWGLLPWSTNSRIPQGTTWSPIHKYIKYEVKGSETHGYHAHQTYAGVPSPEQNKAWDHLIKPAYFNATMEDLVNAGESLHQVTELTGGGYLASLGVYHELHCLRQIRLWLYKDHYYPSMTDAQDRYMHGHLDHCLEALRETIMCYGNTNVISFYWTDPDAEQPSTQSNAKSVCAKWDSIETWGYSRMVPTSPDYQRPHVD